MHQASARFRGDMGRMNDCQRASGCRGKAGKNRCIVCADQVRTWNCGENLEITDDFRHVCQSVLSDNVMGAFDGFDDCIGEFRVDSNSLKLK
jgi:hypothetical protein